MKWPLELPMPPIGRFEKRKWPIIGYYNGVLTILLVVRAYIRPLALWKRILVLLLSERSNRMILINCVKLGWSALRDSVHRRYLRLLVLICMHYVKCKLEFQ